jgi:transcriptional regulator with XRE-family HTH domain
MEGKVDKTATFQGKPPEESNFRWLQRGASDDELVPIMGERLRAARRHHRLSLEALADRIPCTMPHPRRRARGDAKMFPQHLSKCERGERTRLGTVRALARHLAPPNTDPSYLLWWFVNKDTALCHRPDLSATQQFALWAEAAKEHAAFFKLLRAEREQSGQWGVPVKLPDGSEIRVVKHPPRSPKNLATD